MKMWHIVILILLMAAASKALDAGSQCSMSRHTCAVIGNEIEIGVDPSVEVKCSTETEFVELYLIPNDLSETFHVTLWAEIDPAQPFEIVPEHAMIMPGESVQIKLKHAGVLPGVYNIPIVMGLWDDGWEINMKGIITVYKVEV